jgi:hypothetical protein
MKSLTIYDIATGEVKKTLVVPTNYIPSLESGESFLDGQYDDDKFMVVNGKPVKRPVIMVSNDYYEPQPVTESELRMVRDNLLKASDWTQLADAPVDRAAWAAYRQALRDLPESADDPRDIIWPKPPLSFQLKNTPDLSDQ